jgi:hypothetical protein
MKYLIAYIFIDEKGGKIGNTWAEAPKSISWSDVKQLEKIIAEKESGCTDHHNKAIITGFFELRDENASILVN